MRCRSKRGEATMKELWKPVPDYEGLYEVSNYGRVKNSLTGQIMTGTINSYGYRVYRLSKGQNRKDFKGHRMVALAFLPTIPGKNDVNHKDGDKLNNSVDNLEWVTRRENNYHARNSLGLSYDSIPVWQISKDGKPLAWYPSASIAATLIGGSATLISACCKGTASSAYDYRWEFDNSTTMKNGYDYKTVATMAKTLVTLSAELTEKLKTE